MAKKSSLRCDCCGKAKATLGCYGDADSEAVQAGKRVSVLTPVQWWMCGRCFNLADKIAYDDGRRYPANRDYAEVRRRKGLPGLPDVVAETGAQLPLLS